ncbi:hypothetical protein NONO_c02010 [Nocardia nova SH22a]|uniref:Uncharacterized protein n=1 Tax=Nocardia nova SH22a TaxID=1415166 RepID=W5T7S5_9NOCA|nr:hypothetical protein [Nocardia nova]AHH15018.1 hypothetical protein NONO_c02010 [Nocardia nova SH22a]
MIPGIIAAIAALAGVFLGGRLTQQREANNWSRDQQLKAYTELLAVVEESSEAFTLLAAWFRGVDYEWSRIEKEPAKVRQLIADWDAGLAKLGKAVTAAELVVSRELCPKVMSTRFASHRQQMVLMKFDYLKQIDAVEWKAVEDQAHTTVLKLRSALRDDIQRTLGGYRLPLTARLRRVGRRATKLYRRRRAKLARPEYVIASEPES